jgi:predicted dehydrogenase
MERLRVGIVGAGWMGHEHARAWRANDARGVVASVADVSPARAGHLAGQIGGEVPTFADLEAMLAGADLDAVDICLPHHLHADAIVAAARAGKAILCEKPLCLTLEEAARIRRTLAETGAIFMAAHNQLFQPSLVEARRLLTSGVLGRPFVFRSVEASQNRGFATGRVPVELGGGESPWAWRADRTRMGGGEALDTGWHATYRLLALADDRPVEVTAMMDRFHIAQLAAEDTAAIMVRFASGAIGEILTSWAFAPVSAPHFEVGAERGSLAGGKTWIAHQLHGWPEAAELTFTTELAHTFDREVAHFLDVVLDGEPCQATFDHAARALQVLLGAYAAAESHGVVPLPDDPTELDLPAG